MKRAPLILLGLLAAAGCRHAAGPMMVQGDVKLGGTDSAEYLDTLSSRETVTEAGAVEGILLLLGKEQKTTFAEAVAFLKEREIVGPRWSFRADRDVTKGRVAYMVYQACDLKGGLTLTLTGPSPRYCLKELQYLGLMTEGQTYNTVTGMEYVAILARADELRQTGQVSDVMKKEEAAE
jgi:hypothetical protein